MKLVVLSVIGTLLACPAQAQNTTCTTIGNVTNCQQQGGSHPPYDYSGLNAIANAPTFADRQAERDRIKAQADFWRAQTQAIKSQNEATRERYYQNNIQSPNTPGINDTSSRSFVAPLDTRKDMGRLLQAGKCEEAINMALNVGDIALAADTKRFCAQ